MHARSFALSASAKVLFLNDVAQMTIAQVIHFLLPFLRFSGYIVTFRVQYNISKCCKHAIETGAAVATGIPLGKARANACERLKKSLETVPFHLGRIGHK